MYDPESSLSYLNARYYNPVTTQFLSQDPIFWSSSQDLSDPQSLNSYSYALNNPVNRKDPSGKASIVAALKSLVSALQSFVNSLRGGGSSSGSSSNSSSQSSNSGKSTQIQPPGGWVTQQRSTGCFDACADMAGYRPKAENRIVTSTFVNGALTTQSDAKQGIQTIDNYIANGKTPIVGVNVNGGTNSDNANRATQHFVVIVGSGVDNGGKYYNFYDPGTSYESKGASPDNKLYLNGDILSGKSVYNQNTATYVVTEVRPQ
jgi:RHS repeat-associated protein